MKNTPLTCVVLEDEVSTRDWIIKKSKSFPDIEIIGYAETIDDAFYLLAQQKPDFVFMDIRLIGGEAFQLLERLKQNNIKIPYIICITGFPDYVMTALNDYRNYVVQFLLKPFSANWEAKLRKGIDAVIAAKSSETTTLTSSIPDHTFLNHQGNLTKIVFEKIVYLEVGGSGKSIIVTDDKNYEVDYTLNKLMSILPDSFFRISRNNAVNINQIHSIHKSDRTVELIHQPKNKNISISENYYSDFLSQLPLAIGKLK